jgi:hypothetical protein
MEICAICGLEFMSKVSLHKHCGRKHRINVREYTITYELNGIAPKCACGCGEDVNWYKGTPKRFVHTHQTRDVELRKQMIEAGRSAARDPEKRKITSDKLKLKWQNADWRAAAIERLKIARKFSFVGNKELYSSEKFRQCMSDKMKKQWKSVWGAEQRLRCSKKPFRDKVSASVKVALSDPVVRQKLSEHAVSMVEQGIIGPNQTKRSSCVNVITGQAEYFHSDWEHVFFDHMSKVGTPVTKNHGIRIPYVFENVEHIYVPDFQSLSDETIYEIKGRVIDVDAVKFTAAQKYCVLHGIEFIVLFKKDIDDLVNKSLIHLEMV